MTTRSFLVAVAAAALAGCPAAARDLTITTPTGGLHDLLDEVYFKPFTAAAGVPVQQLSWDGGVGILRIEVDSPAAPWDVVLLEADDLLAGCEAGLLDKLDWSAIGGRDRLIPQGVSECGAGAVMASTVLAWDRDKFAGVPSWADFWDVAKFPGKRGLRRGARTTLEIALLADGVAPSDVYRTLRTDEGVERAFRKLDQLKPYIAWWHSDAQSAQLVDSGDVLFAAAPNVPIAAANREGRHFGTQWAGSLYTVDSWAIVRSSDDKPNGLRFLAFATDPAVQAKMLPLAAYGGLAKGANEGLPPNLQPTSPSWPANLSGALQIDEAFWRENLDRLSARYDAWLAR